MQPVYSTAVILLAQLLPVLTTCPSGSNVESIETGSTSPSTPTVTVGATCYTVNVLGTTVLECKDSKGSGALLSARWLKAPGGTQVIQSTGSFINGDISNPNLTVSSAQSSYAGNYTCQLCYGSSYTQCTDSSTVTLIVNGTASLGGSCAGSVTCSTAFSSCISSVCTCNTGYFDNNGGSCTAQLGLGVSCSTSLSNQCSDSHALCTGSPATCQCDSGYIDTNGACATVPPSSNCPTGYNSMSTVTGTTSPSTPSVTVGQTCYEVNLYGTQVMECRDSKGTSALQSARWLLAPDDTPITQSTGSFINGDITNPNLTVSSALSSYAGNYSCQLCYGPSYTQCTISSAIILLVNGTVASVTASVSSSTPLRGSQVIFTCLEQPQGSATSFAWYFNEAGVSTTKTYSIDTIDIDQDGSYRCETTDSSGTVTSEAVAIDVQYLPEPTGGATVTTAGDLEAADIVITCNMNANPPITFYTFYNNASSLLQNSSSNTYTVTSSSGYQTYSCRAQNSVGASSSSQYHDVTEDTIGVGAATENTGVSTATIAAIILGIIFLLLLIIIIIVCCCSFGWCRKKEKVEPAVVVEKPAIKPYIPSISTSVEPQPVHRFEDLDYATAVRGSPSIVPKYYLTPAIHGGPIISMYSDGCEQPRALQLPDLDTQYLYPDDEPKKRKKKQRRHRRRDDVFTSQPDFLPAPEFHYAEISTASDDDIVVVPGKQNFYH